MRALTTIAAVLSLPPALAHEATHYLVARCGTDDAHLTVEVTGATAYARWPPLESRALRVFAFLAPTVFGVVLSLLAGDLGPLFVGGVPALALLLLLAVLGAVHDAIRFGWLTYRVGDDGVVGVDRLFGRAQWRVPAWKVERADVERTLADRLVGTETLVVSHDDREIRITNVPDADALVPDRTPDAAAVDATAPDS